MSSSHALGALNEALGASEFLTDLARVRDGVAAGSVLFPEEALRALSADEIAALEANRNVCSEWSGVRVASRFDPDRIFDSRFLGSVVLGAFAGEAEVEGGATLPTGVYRSVLADCEVGSEALVSQVGLLSRVIVREGAVLSGCGTVACTKETSFGNGIELPIAIETGGREVGVYAETTVEAVAEIASTRGDKSRIAEHVRLVEEYATRARSPRGVVGRHAVVANTPRVVNSYLGDHCRIRDAASVTECTLLGTEEEPSEIGAGAIASRSILQWGARVEGGALVERSVLTEHSRVGRHGKVVDSLIGPNTGIEAGEVTASLVGPFVGFHHQALLIAAFWPEGKGNVAYGANVGSNHTAKAADQEIWPGEGTFFGLGCNIKFPSDFTDAPYSVIATGVTTLPQRLGFPFSLVNSPGEARPGISPAFNEIVPGWVLSDNLFGLRRSEWKFRERDRARRSSFEYEILRPDLMERVRRARAALEGVDGAREFYTGREIAGLGKNYLTEANRVKGIETYTYFLSYYALSGLRREAAALLEGGEAPTAKRLMEEAPASPRWAHEREVLQGEGHGSDLPSDLRRLAVMLREMAESVQSSKEKDDRRGPGIIADYASAHAPAGEDPFVIATWKEVEAAERALEELAAAITPPA